MQARMRAIKALCAALRAARPQSIFAPWDRGREKDVKSADAFALLRLRARIAIAYLGHRRPAVQLAERASFTGGGEHVGIPGRLRRLASFMRLRGGGCEAAAE